MSNRPPTNISSSREGVCEKFYNDPRITRVGKVIRKLSIDELPQLFNVLLGDMALIGPRPALVKEVNQYDQRTLERLKAMPGITGLWQVSGRADTTFSQQVDLDISYVRNRSVFLDLKIAFLTIPAVLSAKGAY
jgi:lipopolysaccharide/colanic/teichoic acid biosynthesis glycosyltransferase